MSETKRVPTWDEIHDADVALRMFESAAAMAAKTLAMFDGISEIEGALQSAETENVCVARVLREWRRTARLARESEDLERKKAGLA
jgi:hypothetical protein